MRIVTVLAVLAAALAFGACKKKSEEGGGAAANPPVADTPPVDCAQLLAKIAECKDTFFEAYAVTEFGKDADQKMFQQGILSPDMGPEMCKQQWINRTDGWWKARYNACYGTPDCAVWGACMANALGNPREATP